MIADNGGPAFPVSYNAFQASHNGISKREWFATFAPPMPQGHLQTVMEMERSANPHNDTYRTPRRSEMEIQAEYAFKWADAMIEASKK